MNYMEMSVVKRDGSIEPLQIEKVHKVTAWACEGLNVSQSELETEAHLMLFNGIKTADIHEALIKSAATLISVENPDYTFVAARLLLQKLYKGVNNSVEYPSLLSYVVKGCDEGRLNAELLKFNFVKLDAAIDPKRDLLFQYLGLQTLADRYLIRRKQKNGNKIIELPQHMWMRVAMGLALDEDDPTARAIEFYDVLSKLEFVSSTPTLFNSGTSHSQLSSCFLTTVEDSIDGIFSSIHECANLSKYAGGIGTDWTRVRPAGDEIVGTNGVSSGVVPYLKIFNDTAVAVNQGGKRKGSFAAYLEPWHPDFLDFIDLKKNSGDERRRAHDIFPAAWIPDLFMKRVKENGIWSFFSPKEFPELHELFGEEFERRYVELEQQGKARKQMPAMDVWKKILTSLFETGHPWITFKDECNRRNPQDHLGVIHNSNLCCIAADQRVVTDRGMMTVGDLYRAGGENVVMGLTGPSNASAMLLPRPNAPMVQIETAEGYSHKVTPDHRVWKKGQGWIEAQELVPGDKLLIQQGEGLFGTERNVELAIITGLITGDGTFTDHSVCIDLWEGKTTKFVSAVETLAARLLADNKSLVTTSTNTPKFSFASDGKKARLSSAPLKRLLEEKGFTAETKLSVPEFVWQGDRDTVSAYLRGLYMTDGHIQTGLDACTLVLSSVNKKFLQEIQILWANYGVKTTICEHSKGGIRDFGESYGGEYLTQQSWRIIISSIKGCKIAQRVTQLGNFRYGETVDIFNERIKKDGYQQKMYATFTGLTQLPNEDAYCLTVDSDTHAWTVNGVITHNTEITLNTSDAETAVCNLGSINLARVNGAGSDLGSIHMVIQTAIRMLDNVIDINFYPSAKAKYSNLRHRPIGLGVMGYMEWLVKNEIDWESQEHLDRADELFEKISMFAINASCELAKERGAYATFKGSKWDKGILPIDTARDKFQNYDWSWLREKVKQYGMRNSNVMAIAPTATISNIAGTTPCIEPIYKRTYTEGNLSGSFLVVDPTLRYGHPELCKESFDIDPLWIIKAAAVRQKWLDQSQSVNIFVKAGIKGSQLAEIYMKAWELGLKTTYYLRSQSTELKVKRVEMTKETEEPQFCSIEDPSCESCQ